MTIRNELTTEDGDLITFIHCRVLDAVIRRAEDVRKIESYTHISHYQQAKEATYLSHQEYHPEFPTD